MKIKKLNKIYHVAIIFPDQYSFLNNVMEGVLGIQSIRKYCRFRIFTLSDFNKSVEFPSGYNPDGCIVCYDEDVCDAEWLDDLGVPVVNIFKSMRKKHPSVTLNYDSLVKTVVDHFSSLDFETIGFLGTLHQPCSQEIQQLFEEECAKRKIPFWVLYITDGIKPGSWSMLEQEAPELREYLQKSFGSVGVYAYHDRRASLLVDYCVDMGIKVPEEVGVLGRFDTINARLCTPELSSVIVPAKQIGVRVIKLLVQLMAGEEELELHQEIEVREVRVRASTVGKEDPDMMVLHARAMIREQACDGLTVNEIVETLTISRSSFEKRYRELVGVSAAQEIRAIRIETARQLLLTSKMSLEEVAKKVGFHDSRPFVVFFRREVGVTPGAFRRSHR